MNLGGLVYPIVRETALLRGESAAGISLCTFEETAQTVVTARLNMTSKIAAKSIRIPPHVENT